jgi:hypothetical protein
MKKIVTDAQIFNARVKAPGHEAFGAAQKAIMRNYDYMLYNGMVVDLKKPLSFRDDFKNAVVFTPSKNYYSLGFEFDGWKEPLHYTGSNPFLKIS